MSNKAFNRRELGAALLDLAGRLSDESQSWTVDDYSRLRDLAGRATDAEFERTAAVRGTGNIVSRATFDGMSANEKMAFMRGGGRITD